MCIENALVYLDWQPRVIPVSEYMLFFETGDRVIFEGEHFKRRSALGSLLLAECVEAKGRFIAKIVDIAWLICEESSWGLPATELPKEHLPDTEQPTLELFACETGNLMSYLLHIMGSTLDGISPMLCTRIEREIKSRIITPFLERDDFTWMGLGGNTGSLWKLSNWTPWCYSNCLSALLIVEQSEEKRLCGIEKVMQGLGRFLAEYRTDGGCDEGCGYWARSAGSVLDCLELLKAAAGIDIYDKPIIKNMGEYIVNCYAGSGYFVNFADAGARVIPEAELVHRYGVRIGSSEMRALGKSFIDTYLKERYYTISQSPMRLIPAILNYAGVKADAPQVTACREKYYPVTEVCMVHPAEKWFFAAKGGHNNETHNHNDVGGFVLYYDGKPVFADPGVEKYSGKTFGEHRYELWTMQSDYHNLPKINGISQHDGEEFHADNFCCEGLQASCEIQNAYPPEAGVKRWHRRIYEENGSIFISEEFEFAKESSYEIMLITPEKPEIKAGTVKLGDISLAYDSSVLGAEFDTIEIDDAGLRKVWGSALYRLRFSNVQTTTGSRVVFEINKL